jgi:hypothetical protein
LRPAPNLEDEVPYTQNTPSGNQRNRQRWESEGEIIEKEKVLRGGQKNVRA